MALILNMHQCMVASFCELPSLGLRAHTASHCSFPQPPVLKSCPIINAITMLMVSQFKHKGCYVLFLDNCYSTMISYNLDVHICKCYRTILYNMIYSIVLLPNLHSGTVDPLADQRAYSEEKAQLN